MCQAILGKSLTVSLQPKRDKFAGLSRKAKRRKLAKEDDATHQDERFIKSSIRDAKKAQRPTKIGLPEAKGFKKEKKGKGPKRKTTVKLGKGLGFGKDAADATKRSREGTRSKKGDAIGGGKGKPRTAKGRV